MTMYPLENLDIPIRLKEEDGLERSNEPVRTGVPLVKGSVNEVSEIALFNGEGNTHPCQFTVLEKWPDGSCKWMLLDFLADLVPGSAPVYHIRKCNGESSSKLHPISIEEQSDSIRIDTGSLICTVENKNHTSPLSLQLSGTESPIPIDLLLKDRNGRQLDFVREKIHVEERGPLRCSVRQTGRLGILNASLVYHLYAGCDFAVVDILIHNPRNAQHSGGLWDLGDPGSVFIEECSFRAKLPASPQKLIWQISPDHEVQEAETEQWHLYQDSSGGEHWNSPNHVDCNDKLSVTFPGFRLHVANNQETVRSEGERANPFLLTQLADVTLSGAIRDFWQNFPKGIHLHEKDFSLDLFPREAKSFFEIQGGEQKRHTVFLQLGREGDKNTIPQLLAPVTVTVDPDWIAESKAISYFSVSGKDTHSKYYRYINNIIEGEHSFVKKRELIDEYGWRNYGDTYADHEAVNHKGEQPFVSHYNNQYDFIYGASVHFLRSGDRRWWDLAVPAARHMIDIDIYHTDQDRAAYNGGLFWHSDHYLQAKTASHRAYSIKNKENSSYGGGTSNEHIYSSGLTLYYFLTGDVAAKEAVLELADYVLNMDDGRKTLFSLFDEGPTGIASQTVYTDYHSPGRGPGNCINCLIDAYRLSGQRKYFAKAEELLQRCIHPKDDIPKLGLDEPEYRWSYLVFLQILGKYIDYKKELGEIDYFFFYGRDSLLHYAQWMAQHEVPYKDVLDKVLIPTETWPAHDIRKCHIFHLAAKYGTEQERRSYAEKAAYFFSRCLDDLLSFETAFLARPLILLGVYGYIHDYFLQQSDTQSHAPHTYNFGLPQDFLPQKQRFKGDFIKKVKQTLSIVQQRVQEKNPLRTKKTGSMEKNP